MISTTADASPVQAPPAALRLLAKVVSYVFHPLFMPAYVAFYLIYIHPYTFASLSGGQKNLRMLSVIVQTVFFPAMTVFLLWRLKFADNIYLRTQKERIIPYVATNIFFFWAFYVSRNMAGSPAVLTSFFLGIFLTSAAALLANNYFRISMHAMGVGGAAMYMILLGMVSGNAINVYIALFVLMAGIVCSARLLLKDHEPFEVYWGLALAALCQLIAGWFIL